MTRWLVALTTLIAVCALNAPAASAADALPYAGSYLLTGGYVASGVDLSEPDWGSGFATGTIHISGVPADADIVAAYLYYETITLSSHLSDAKGAAFRDNTVLLNDVMAVKKSKQNLTGPLASCWSSGSPLTATMFRVDVLRWLPIRMDKDNLPTGKRLVNDADLLAHGLPLHKVKLPVRDGNQVPESAGATLVLVYRDPSQSLKKIVFYDGIHVQSSASEVTTQTLQGFYRSSASKSARLTHILAGGQPNKYERIFFDDGLNTQISSSDPVSGGNSSQRGWSTLTYDVSALMKPGNNSAGGFGETAKTTIDHSKPGAYDCLTMGAVIFSTSVADVDHDGLPDGLEDAAGGLKDPDGQLLPNLNAMGASSSHKDLFMEFNALWAPVGTSYGGPNAPYDAKNSITTVTDLKGHNHMPTPETLKMMGDAYVAHGITPHFDVGDLVLYHAPNPLHDPSKLGVATHSDWVDDYTSTVADAYLVPTAYARGGEVIKELACNAATPGCIFPDFPGTVGWKFGLQMYRDQPVGDNGEEVSLHPGDANYFNWNAGSHRRRFDRNRFGLVHYVLNAHARGNPKSDFPCLTAGVPVNYPSGTASCGAGGDNPDFHHPTTASGVADLPGGNILVTLGLWDDFVGRPFVRASTTFHENGHNLGLWHGGFQAFWGNKHPLIGPATSTYIEPNCKPNYLSSMSYLFQVIGLFDKFDQIHLDYSDRDYSWSLLAIVSEKLPLIDLVPPDWSAAPNKYVPAWFAPAGSALAVSQGATKSTRYCDGSQFGSVPPPDTARVHATDIFSPIDWDGNPATHLSGPQNVNFDGTPDGKQTFSLALRGFDDWASIRLDQIGAGRNAVKFQDGDFADFGSGDFADFGSGDFTDYGSGDFLDFGSGDFTDFGSGVFLSTSSGDFADFGSGDFTDFGSGDFADFGSGDFLDFGSGSERQEITYTAALALFKGGPYGLVACIVGRDAGCAAAAPFTTQYHRVQISFSSSSVGTVLNYEIQRKKGNDASGNPYVAAGTSLTKSFIDPTALPNNQEFTYRVRTQIVGESPSPWSKSVTIVALNDAPTAYNDTFSSNEDATLAADVLTNDTDDDSNHAGLRAVVVSLPSTGTLTSHAVTLHVGDVFDGTFAFAPAADYEGGPITFTYKANDGKWTDGTTPMSPDSNTATVTISVVSRHTITTISSAPVSPAIYGDPMTFMAAVTSAASPPLGTPGGQVQFSIDGGPAVTVGIGAAFTPAARLSAGMHTITAKYCGGVTSSACAAPAGDGVFYGSATTINYQVQPRPVAVAADAKSKTFGDADPPLTYHITSGSLASGDAFSGSLTRAIGENAGPYAITQGTLALSSNYALAFTGATFTVDPRPISVSADAQMKLYGSGDDPPLTYSISSGSLLGTDDFSGSLSRDPGEAAGTYAINQDTLSLSPNYQLIYTGASFTIAQLSWISTATEFCGDVSIDGNSISMGSIGLEGGNQPQCIHGATALLPSRGANTKYKVTFEYNLSTWDSYNAFTVAGTGYWDSFSVSVSNPRYPALSLADPITTANLPGLAFIWGGTNYSDGVLECNPASASCSILAYDTTMATVPASLAGASYLNVVLDSTTLPDADTTHPSWGTIRIINVTLVP